MDTPIPPDLVLLQCTWYDTYARLAAGAPDGTVLRRRLLSLSVRIWWHPYWRTVPAGAVSVHRSRVRALARASGASPDGMGSGG
ncbi:hypothetical protein [Streptomyces yaizuensis]|uniref:Uncharacterized protein n=1 Tax=Streptomyces yaizuensis TaxID=2989713 RepID=A0ABQ5P6N4_9ACTN|nr:hypothetical protein [Streptomyces sp. YSPA8]GLF98252.1 hypothetical protein SYYSPA8_28165 [Streptomyces sp. YSPA8]